MADAREKLIEILKTAYGTSFNAPHLSEHELEPLASHLIANGVTVQDSKVVEIDQFNQWIPVSERLPENEVDVLICAERRLYGMGGGERKTVRVISAAFHTDGKMNTEDSGYNWELDNVDMDYDEEADAYIVPEGWWESVRYGEEFSAVDDFVTHWMPLPEPPKGD